MSQIPPELAATVAAVVDEGSLDAAARVLHLTPSAVSQRIKALEHQLGRVLIVRGKPATATEAGEVIVRMARQVALLEHDALTAFGIDARDERVRVSLAVNADSLATWFLPPLARLTAQHRIDFDLHRDDQNFTARLLEAGDVMAAVTSQKEPVAGCRVTSLGGLVYAAVATPEFHARWFPDGVSADALAAAPFVNFDRRDRLQEEWLAEWGVSPTRVPRHYVPASHDFALAIGLGMGWGLVPYAQHAELADRVVPLGGPVVRVPLYWQQWSVRSALLDAIAGEVADEAARVLAPEWSISEGKGAKSITLAQ